MKFTANRELLLEAIKTTLKVVSSNHDIPEISGVLLEADADAGILSLTGTDIRTYIQRKLRQEDVEESGSAVLTPLVAEILQHLEGENAEFQSEKNILRISAGKAVFTIPFLAGKAFPKLQIPFPEDTICIRGIKSLIRHTVFATDINPDSVGDKQSMQYVKLNFSNSTTRAEATNGKCVAMAAFQDRADGNMEMFLHHKALRILQNIVGESEEMFAGIVGKFAVFMKEDLFFSTMMYAGKFIAGSQIVARIEPFYRARTDARKLNGLTEYATAVFQSGDDLCITLHIDENKIRMEATSGSGTVHSSIEAIETNPTPEKGFHYNPQILINCLRQMSGPVDMALDKRGFLLLTANRNSCFICPRGPAHIWKKEEKDTAPEKKITTKTKSKTKATKAA